MNKATKVRPWITMLRSAAVTALLGASVTATAQAPYEVVLVNGTMSGSEDMFFEAESTDSANPTGVLDQLCSNRSWVRAALGLPPDLSGSAGSMLGSVGTILGTLGQQALPDPNPEAQEAFDEYEAFCNDRGSKDNFNILYSQCSMTMWSQGAVLRWVLPPGGDATMNILSMEPEFTENALCSTDGFGDFVDNPTFGECPEGQLSASAWVNYITTMTVNLENFMEEDEYLPKGTATDFEITPGGGGGEYLGVPTRAVEFKYEGTMNPMMMGAANSAEGGPEGFPLGQITMVSEGTAYVNRNDVPGAHIVSDFYTNLKQKLEPGSSADTLFGAMFHQMAGVMSEGFPLSLSQETAVRIEGMPELFAPTIGQKSFSEMNVAGVLHFMSDAEWCAVGEPPSDWRVVTLEDMMSPDGTNAAAPGTGSSPGPGGGAGASEPGGISAMAAGTQMSEEQAAEMASAMQQAAEAMENMTPEQRQMMEQFGMGDMLQQMTGGANPAAQQAAAATAAGAGASGRSGSTMPPSEELNAGTLTESVQRHLKALGYDVGDVDGEVSLQTTIAISTFQAEKAIEVTGEVTPQLLGILSAEVDSRR